MKIILSTLMLLSYLFAEAQDITLKGRIIDEYLTVLPFVKIINQNDEVIGTTNNEGKFEIPLSEGVLKLKIYLVGMEPTIIELSDSCTSLEVVLMFDSIYDYMSLNKVDRLRMKRFKKLPKLHKEAFEKGIFKTDKPCYKRKFVKTKN